MRKKGISFVIVILIGILLVNFVSGNFFYFDENRVSSRNLYKEGNTFSINLSNLPSFQSKILADYFSRYGEFNLSEDFHDYDFFSTDVSKDDFIKGIFSDKMDFVFPEKSEGYIIEFESPPVLARKGVLEQEIFSLKTEMSESEGFFKLFFLRREISKKEKEKESFIRDSYKEELLKRNNEIKKEIFSIRKQRASSSIPFFGFFMGFLRRFGLTGFVVSEEISPVIERDYFLVFNGISIKNISEEDAIEIGKIKGVKKVWSNRMINSLLPDSVPLIQGGILAGQLDEDGNECLITGKQCLTGEGVKIAIIDTGVDYTHPDLGGCLGENCKVIGGYNFVNYNYDPIDDNGHGTHVAGIAAANGSLKGVAPDAKILAYKVLDFYGSGWLENVIAGIERAVEDDADILSLSLGGWGDPDDPISQAVDNAVLDGKVVVVAAGNYGPSEIFVLSPGTARKAITVGSSTKKNNLSDFSSRGPVLWMDENEKLYGILKPDVLAPGGEISVLSDCNPDSVPEDGICSTFLEEEYLSAPGTSMSTPHIAGAIALLKQKNPDWTPDEIKSSLKATASDLNYSLIEQGAGVVNVSAFISLNEPLAYEEPENWTYLVGYIGYDSYDILFTEVPFNLTSLIFNFGAGKTENANYSVYYQEGFCGKLFFFGILISDIPCDNLKLIASGEFELDSVFGKEEALIFEDELLFEENIEVSFENPGLHTIVMKYDAENSAGPEGISYGRFTIYEQGPNVKISIDYKNYIYSFFVGENYNLSYFLENIGTEIAEDVSSFLYSSKESKYFLIDSKSFGSVDVGERKEFNFSFNPKRKGDYFLLAEVLAKEDVNLKDNELDIRKIKAINKGRDIGISSVEVFSYYSYDNYIRVSIEDYGTDSIGKVNVSLFINDNFVEKEVLSYDYYSLIYSSFDIPEEYNGKDVKIKILVEFEDDMDLSDNVFEDFFYIYENRDVVLSVKNFSGDYADRRIVFFPGGSYEDSKDAKEGEMDIPVLEGWGIGVIYTEANDSSSLFEEGYEGFLFGKLIDTKENEDIFTERYESLSENNVTYYKVHVFNTSLNYSFSLGEFFSYLGNFFIFDEFIISDLSSLEFVYCKNFDFQNNKCISKWDVFEDSYFLVFFFLVFGGFSYEGEIDAFAIVHSYKGLFGVDERIVEGDFFQNYEKWNSYGRIEFLEEVNISRIKENRDLLSKIQIVKKRISVDVSVLEELNNVPARLTFKNIDCSSDLTILRNGVDCGGHCSDIVCIDEENVLLLNVTSFSVYEVVESSYCGDGFCDADESCETCVEDCGICIVLSSYCGDGICQSREDYISCPEDCDAPPLPPPSGGTDPPAPGDTTSQATTTPPACTPQWKCEFGSCINNQQKEVCIDLKNCNVSAGKPQEKTRSCSLPVTGNTSQKNDSLSTTDKEKDSDSLIGYVFFVLFFIFLLIFLLIIIFIFLSNRKPSSGKGKIQTSEQAEGTIRELLVVGREFLQKGMIKKASKVYYQIKDICEKNRNISRELYLEVENFFNSLTS